ncbi:MAG: hypothetical protein CMJ58_12725 [Planctomycetaceae bacterium]|nr:hypothetical protein [Planctomycetaceae bacterium]
MSKLALRVTESGFIPADRHSADQMHSRGYSPGDVVFAEIRKPRSPGFHRLAHAFGQLLVDNLQDFAEMDSHKALKRLQLESGIGCDEVVYRIPGYGMAIQRLPKSLSFASMDEGQFREVFRGLCRHVAAEYWPSCTPEQIEHMAQCMVGE